MSAHTNTGLSTLIVPFDPSYLPQMQGLINAHLSLLVPGWALSEAFIASHLQRNPGQAITDPWVAERTTLCALEGPQVVAAVHLLRYGRGPQVGHCHVNGSRERSRRSRPCSAAVTARCR